ncbi:tlde1 domain-containing protein [Rosenbergiella epipactidis]|uniref:tlde1 domain-containing protein n=1 Tax=Rosenbergiella epipactidis TaxID=1544694 RepID=UPI001F4EC04D|nr:tlde1 domain-containing protein [Rosenbergiella epipactidis]
MPWIYQQSTGRLHHNQQFIEQGYSGFPPHVNRADSQHIPNSGPIPIGDYRIGKVTTSRGPLTLVLHPAPNTIMFGRHSFRIHGDSLTKPGYASQGCIILSARTRQLIANSADRLLRVIK